jgi:hypothetical protein
VAISSYKWKILSDFKGIKNIPVQIMDKGEKNLEIEKA